MTANFHKVQNTGSDTGVTVKACKSPNKPDFPLVGHAGATFPCQVSHKQHHGWQVLQAGKCQPLHRVSIGIKPIEQPRRIWYTEKGTQVCVAYNQGIQGHMMQSVK